MEKIMSAGEWLSKMTDIMPYRLSEQTEPYILELMKQYAEQEIKADRERIIAKCTVFKSYTCQNCFADYLGYVEADRNAIEHLPITLP